MKPPHPSDLALERHALAELPPSAREELEQHLTGCPPCRQRLAALAADDEQFAADLGRPTAIDRAVAAITAAAAPRPRRWRPAALAATLAAAAGLTLWIWPATSREFDGRTKGGGVRLEVVRRTPDGAQEWLASAPRVQPGDALRFRVRTPAPGYVAVLGLDAAGAVSAYAPAGATMQPLAAHQPTTLDDSVVLDATLGAERLVALVCPTPRPVAELVLAARRALEAAGGDPRRVAPLTAECQEQAMVLVKEAR